MHNTMWRSQSRLLTKDSVGSFTIPAIHESREETLPKAQYNAPQFHEEASPFRFSAHRTRVDWGLLYGIDPQEVVKPNPFV